MLQPACLRAIELKTELVEKIEQASVSILSGSAEEEFDFIASSKAILLAAIDDGDSLQEIDALIEKIVSYR